MGTIWEHSKRSVRYILINNGRKIKYFTQNKEITESEKIKIKFIKKGGMFLKLEHVVYLKDYFEYEKRDKPLA